MASILNPIITQGGLAALYNAQNTGVQLALTHIGFGTGAYDPDGQEAALKTEVARVPIASGSRITPTQIRVATVWSDSSAQANITEVGFYAGTVLFAVLSRATGGPYVYKTPAADLVFSYDWTMKAIPAGSVSITTDPTQSAMLALLAAHEQNPDAHAQYAKLTDLSKAIDGIKGSLKLSRVSLTGPTLVYPGSTNTFQITDFDSFSKYTVATDVGTVSISNDAISLVIASSQASGPLNLSVKRDDYAATYQLAIGSKSIGQPTLKAPLDGATAVSRAPLITSSDFVCYPSGADAHASSDWQIATDAAFTAITWQASGDTKNLTSVTPPAGVLAVGTKYYARVRHTGAALGASTWSPVVSFTTVSSYVVAPALATPVEGATQVSQQLTLSTGAFATYPAGNDTQLSARWQISTQSDFSTLAHDSGASTTKLTSYSLKEAGVTLAARTKYYARVRHAGKSLGDSDWSTTVSFTAGYILAGNYTMMSGGGTARCGAGITSNATDFFLIGGGSSLSATSGMNTCYRYSVSAAGWVQMANLPIASNFPSAALLGSKVYVTAGYSSDAGESYVSSGFYCYDIASNAWTTLAAQTYKGAGAPLITYNGKLYKFGGQTAAAGTTPYYTSAVSVYDPATNKWAGHGSMSNAKSVGTAALVGSKVYLFGGGGSAAINLFEVYDIETAKTTVLPVPPVGVTFGASMVAISGRLYVFGGRLSSGSPSNALWMYDPDAAAWTQLASGSFARQYHAATAIGDAMYIFGGLDAESRLIYDLWKVV